MKPGDVMYVDACGVDDRYHVDVCRTFAIGRDHPGARAILEQTAQQRGGRDRAVQPGRSARRGAAKVAEEYVFARFARSRCGGSGGYALGIAMPPDWVGHTYLSNDAFEQFTWEPGYVTNYENILFDREAGFTASYMETLLMAGADRDPLEAAAHAASPAPGSGTTNRRCRMLGFGASSLCAPLYLDSYVTLLVRLSHGSCSASGRRREPKDAAGDAGPRPGNRG